MGTSRNV